MGELKLESWQKRPYGMFARGYAEHDDHKVSVRVRLPDGASPDDDSLPKLVTHNGLATGHESMAHTARAAAEMGYMAVAYDYTGPGIVESIGSLRPQSSHNPLGQNARDGLTVVESLPPGEISLHGLSMGGAVATLVANNTDREIAWLNLVSPGGYTHRLDQQPARRIVGALHSELIEELSIFLRHPSTASRVALDSLRTCRDRRMAWAAEFRQLLHETVYADLREFRANQPAAKVLLAHASRDNLIPRTELLQSIDLEETNGRLIDVRYAYDGGHARSGYDSQVTKEILQIETVQPPIPDVA